MPNIITVPEERADQLLNTGAYGASAVIRLQTATTEAGIYADVTGTGSTPTLALVSGTRIYTGYDPAGLVSSWYRTRYENVGASRVSDWSTPFQVGDEQAGLLCSVYDVRQRLGIDGTTEDENIIEGIRAVSRLIEHYCQRWLSPRPLNGTTTYRFHTEAGYSLHIPRGIRSITSLGIATEDQPDSGGTYAVATSTDYYIDPPVSERTDTIDPGFHVRLRWNGAAYFADATFGAEITGAFGFASVPYDVQSIAIGATVRGFLSKGSPSGVNAVAGPSGALVILRDFGPADIAVLDRYRRLAIG